MILELILQVKAKVIIHTFCCCSTDFSCWFRKKKTDVEQVNVIHHQGNETFENYWGIQEPFQKHP